MEQLLFKTQHKSYKSLESEDVIKQGRATHPEDEAPIASLFMWWLFPILQQIYKTGSLSESDTFNIRQKHRSKLMFEQFSRYWESNKKRGLPLCLTGFFYKPILAFLIVGNMLLMLLILQLYLIGNLTGYFNNGSISSICAYLSATGIIIIALLYAVVKSMLLFEELRLGMVLRVLLGAVIYAQIHKVSLMKLWSEGSGEIMTLMTTDLEVLAELPRLCEGVVSVLLFGVVLPGLMYHELGLFCIPGIIGIVFGLFMMALPLPLITKLRGHIATRTGKRLRMMRNILHNIETIKINCYAASLDKVIKTLRRNEFVKITYLLIIKLGLELYIMLIPWLTLIITLAVYVYYDEFMSSSSLVRVIAYIYFWAYHNCCGTYFLVSAFQSYKSLKRIEAFLHENVQVGNQSCIPINGRYAVQCYNLHASWAPSSKHEKTHIQDISFQLEKGKFLAVIGPTGAGKSSLLMALLGNLDVQSGSCYITDSVAYCPQEPWIISGTVEENILLGSPIDAQKYEMVKHACSLQQDIERFPHGDKTLIGERGITLSGGQKTRIALARSIYQDKDILLLDDVLSSVDAKVGYHIFNKCFKESDKTIIFVTSQLQYSSQADFLLVLNETGQLEYFGRNDHENPNIGKTLLKPEIEDSPLTQFQNMGSEKHAACSFLTEDSEVGDISWSVYWKFIKAGKGWITLIPILLLALTGNACWKYSDYFLSKWADERSSHTNPIEQLKIFALISGVYQLYGIVAVLLCLVFIMKAATTLHEQMLKSVLGAEMSFFKTPFGIIINRFSRDIGIIDTILIHKFFLSFQFIFIFIGVCVFSCVILPWLTLGILPLALCSFWICKYGMRAGQLFRRREAIARSPIFTAVSNSLEGKVVISALKKEEHFMNEFHIAQDKHTSVYDLYLGTFGWVALYMSLLCTLFFTLAIVLSFVINGNGTLSTLVLVFVNQTYDIVQMTGMTQTEFRLTLTSVERVLSYIKTPQEEDEHKGSAVIPKAWGQTADITFRKVTLTYTHSSSPALSDVSFTIKHGEKIGIIGRTGAGKTSILRALTRLVNYKGIIEIGGVNIKEIDLSTLRQSISYMPQDPVIFNGTLRENLDPEGQKEDSSIWSALERVHLKDFVHKLPGELMAELGEGNQGLSAGQKQLLSLARVLLKDANIIILDEATANVDIRTDQTIQLTLRKLFKEKTVLAIAHRIDTVKNYDKIMVVEHGSIVQFDKPDLILAEN